MGALCAPAMNTTYENPLPVAVRHVTGAKNLVLKACRRDRAAALIRSDMSGGNAGGAAQEADWMRQALRVSINVRRANAENQALVFVWNVLFEFRNQFKDVGIALHFAVDNELRERPDMNGQSLCDFVQERD